MTTSRITRVTRSQRFTRRDPCPVCLGGDDDPRHKGIRCTMGFLSSDGRYAHCGRPEYAGSVKPDKNGVTYAHRLDGPCRCGRPHGEGAAGEPRAIKPNKPPKVIRGRQYLPEHIKQDGTVYVRWADYPYLDAQGKLAYLVRRYEVAGRMPDGVKRAKTFRPFTHRGDDVWVMALEVDPILFNLPAVVAAPLDAPVLVCEGEKAVEAAQDALRAAGALGVVTTAPGGANGTLAVDMTPLKGRHVVILPDADPRDPTAPDAETPGEVYAATFATRARAAGAAQVATLRLDGLADRGDVVEWLAAGHDGADLARLASEALATQSSDPEGDIAASAADAWKSPDRADHLEYRATSNGLRRVKRDISESGVERETLIPLTNFVARIVGDVIQDDGAETSRAFDVEARICGSVQRPLRQFTIPAERFSGMSWAAEFLGAGAIVYPGQSAREHARVAIQVISAAEPEGIPERHEFTHTGWRQIDGAWLYLHTGGALGASGTRTDVLVTLAGVLARYALPDPLAVEHAQPGALAAAIQSSLGMLEIASDEVTIPLYAAIWRAVSGGADFSLHLAGASGGGKSELAALAQQHYGAEMTAKHLPGSWSSSANALEAQAFSAKDALFTVDDFVAAGNLSDASRMHRDADRLLRGQGNGQGRARMRADTSLRPDKPPRGLIVSTGEDTPRGQSLRARMLVLDHAPNSLDWERLTACQHDAAAGTYALALAGYVRWIAGRYDEAQEALRPAAIRAARQPDALGRHRRTSDATAQLAAALALFTRYAIEAGAMTSAEASALRERAERALERVAAQQADGQAQSDPVARFLTLLGSAIVSGAAHVTSMDGGYPESAGRWGWRWRQVGHESAEWQPQGRRVGWLDGCSLYLDPDAAFVAAQALGATSGDGLTITSGTLWKRLRDRGALQSVGSKEAVKARVTCDGARRRVIHLHADALTWHESDGETPLPLSLAQKSANPARGSLEGSRETELAIESGGSGRNLRPDSGMSGRDVASDPGSVEAEPMGGREPSGRIGRVPVSEIAHRAPTTREHLAELAGVAPGIRPIGGQLGQRIRPTPCEHPPRARHRLSSGMIACGLCGAHLQRPERPAVGQVSQLGGGQ